MGAIEYLKQKEHSDQFLATVNDSVYTAYSRATHATKDSEGMLHLEQWEDDAGANKATDIVYEALVEEALILSKSSAKDEFTKARIVFSTFGLTKRTIGEYFRGTKGRKREDRNAGNFYGTVAQTAPAFRYVQNLYGNEIPTQTLSIEEKDKLDLFKYLGITDEEMRKKLAGKISDAATLASLIDKHKEEGILTPKTLEEILKAA